jgi:glutathione S-transferase
MRMRDRFFDLYVNVPVQKIVTDRLRPAGHHDPYGVEQAKALLQTACGMIDEDMATKAGRWGRHSAWPTAPPRRRCSTPTR